MCKTHKGCVRHEPRGKWRTSIDQLKRQQKHQHCPYQHQRVAAGLRTTAVQGEFLLDEGSEEPREESGTTPEDGPADEVAARALVNYRFIDRRLAWHGEVVMVGHVEAAIM